jgi:hypothetical protein
MKYPIFLFACTLLCTPPALSQSAETASTVDNALSVLLQFRPTTGEERKLTMQAQQRITQVRGSIKQ